METAHLLFSSQQLLASFHRWISWKLGELDNFLSVLASGVAWCRNDLPAFHRSFLVRGLVWNITFWFPFQGAGVWEHGLGTSVHPWCPGRGVSTWAIIRHSVFWGFPSEYVYSIQGWIITFKWGQRNGTPTRMCKWVNGWGSERSWLVRVPGEPGGWEGELRKVRLLMMQSQVLGNSYRSRVCFMLCHEEMLNWNNNHLPNELH